LGGDLKIQNNEKGGFCPAGEKRKSSRERGEEGGAATPKKTPPGRSRGSVLGSGGGWFIQKSADPTKQYGPWEKKSVGGVGGTVEGGGRSPKP